MRFAAVVLASLFVVPGTNEIGFAPEEGSTVAKTFAWTFNVSTDKMEINMGGGSMPGGSGAEAVNSYLLATRDTYAKLGDAGPNRLERTYEELVFSRDVENLPEHMRASQENENRPPLEGHSVVFERETDEDEFDVSYAEGDEGDSDILDGLAEDLDLRVLLPEGDVDLSESWDLDPTLIGQFLTPGGISHWKPKPEAPEDTGGEVLMLNVAGVDFEAFFPFFSGDATATLDGIDGDLMTIHVELSLDASEDLAVQVTEAVAKRGVDQVYDSAPSSASFTGEGMLVWNSKRGTFETFTFEGDFSYSYEVTWMQSMGSDESEMSTIGEYSGSIEVEHAVVE